jgi:peptidoglycan/xylan/chitin deacetylase (PgdA/CDA1 family)
MRRFRQTAALLLLACVLPLAAAATPGYNWPGKARAAVSLAYDDALNSQLDIAIPALDKAGLKASFYLQLSNPSVSVRMAEWRAAAARGHELGNHSLFHPCSGSKPGREFVLAHRNLDTMSVAQVADQVKLANVMLYAIDGRRERTFTTPCGDLKAGGDDYLPAIVREFAGIKAGAGDGVAPQIGELDPDAVAVLAPVGMSGKELIAVVKAAADKGTMVNFTFHGIGGDYLVTSREAHAELLAYLAAHRDIYWTDTFLNIVRHVRAQQALK